MYALQPPDEHSSKDLSYQVESARELIQICLRCPSEEKAAKIREYLVSSPEEQRQMLTASEMVQVWKPSGAQDAWNVPWIGAPGHEQSKVLPATRVAIARADCGEPAGGEEHLDRITRVQLYNNPKDWAPLIVQCDQMMMFMNQIDWSKPSEAQRLVRGDLPSFAKIYATIAP